MTSYDICLWLTPLGMTISRFTHVTAKWHYFVLFYGQVIFHPGGGNGNPLQYSCLENPMDRGASWATVHGVAKSWIQLKWVTQHNIPLYTMYFLPIPLSWTFRTCFHVLVTVNSGTMNTGVLVSFQIMFFSRYMPTSGIAGPCGSSMFSF